MNFQSTPLNVTEALLMALGIIALYMLVQKKMGSNVPLLYYIGMIVFMTVTDREVQPYLFYSGMALALVLRFEFINQGFSKIVAGIEIVLLFLILWSSLSHILGPGFALF